MPDLPFTLEPSPAGINQWRPLLDKLLGAYDGAFAIRLPDGSARRFGSAAASGARTEFSLVLRRPQILQTLLLGTDPLRYAEAWFRQDIDIEGDLFAALALKDYLQDLKLPLRDRVRALLHLLRARTLPGLAAVFGPGRQARPGPVRTHSPDENRQAISFHYDLSNDFYSLWLGPGMVYSCAYFERPEMTLAQAQHAKLEHICRKLQLQPGERLLDLGCGWGALLLHAARHYGVQAHGITLSERQYQHVQELIAQSGLQGQISVSLQDYRDVRNTAGYDKIASIGMFEHVGLGNLAQYFATVHRLLRPGGYFLNHGITHNDEGWKKCVSSVFINRYVFPGGELDTMGNIQRAMERADFEIMDVEGWRPHYAETLRHWVRSLEAQHSRALDFVDEATWRIWRLYMAASAMEFEAGALGVYQILSSPRAAGTRAFPRTRRYMYP